MAVLKRAETSAISPGSRRVLLAVMAGFFFFAAVVNADEKNTLPAGSGSIPYPVDFNHPPRDYAVTNAQGWTIWMEKDLVTDHPVLATNALRRLLENLGKAMDKLPAHSRGLLRDRKLFLMLGEHSKLGGKNNGADYFQRQAPQHFTNLDPRMGGAILIYSATNYVWLSDLWALKVLLHELAHAWQLEQWPERQSDIVAAYEQAMREKLYRGVKDQDGQVLETAYAATNQLEYFAELSCMYFVGCNYYPFNRQDLQQYDPRGCALVEKMWRTQNARSTATSSGK